MRKLAAILILALGSGLSLRAQSVTDLFTPKASFSKSFDNIAGASQALSLNSSRLSSLRSAAPSGLQLDLPFENATMTLDLEKVSITTPEFRVTERRPDGSQKTVSYNDGVFYRGKIRGQNQSTVTISLIGGQVMGIISDSRGNIVLGAIEEKGLATEEYTLYRESALNVKNPSACFASDEMIGDLPAAGGSKGNQTGEPIEIYFECDYRMYTDRGSNTTNVVNFVLGFFNETAAIYEAEDIKVQVSQITVWTTQDPEAAAGLNTTSTVLNSFASRMEFSDYIGDYAHFLSRRSLGGGIAYVLGNPCAAQITRYYKTAVSAIDNSYQSYPTYSWTVQVVTHELGHNFGSNHTQWCGWSGGALDNCYPTEANPTGGTACAPGPQPVNSGTIMSYCHLVSSVGINFNNGFGPQPGNRIRQVIGAATCFGTCRMTVAINKFDASCNQSNGSATVVATASTGAVTYLWSNGQTGATLLNAAPGTYSVTVKDGAGCQVIEDVTIINAGTTLTFDITPGTNAGFCAGSDVTLGATVNPSYTYVWSRNGTVIPSAVTASYTASTAGNYSISISSGSCNGTRSITVSQVAAPTATISASGATTFCEGGSVTLNADIGPAYSYQWFRNAVAIAGATQPTFSPANSGSYTVRVAAGNSCSATSTATVVTVNPLPAIDLTAGSPTSFCSGNSVLLSTPADAAYTYVWTLNGNVIAGATSPTYTATASGTYRVTVSRGPCSGTSTPVTVTVFTTPVVTVTPETTTIEKFNTATLTVNGAPNYDLASQPFLVSRTTNSVTVRPPTTTTYTIRGYDANGCEDQAQATVIVIGCGTVSFFDTINLSPSRVQVLWTNPAEVTTDTLQYRKSGETTWTKIFVSGSSYEINGLDPASTYEFNVIPLCTTTTNFIPSANQLINTPALPNGLYVRLFPNPVLSSSRLEIISATPYELSVALYDHGGKLVGYPVSSGNFPAGQTIRTIESSKLAAGIYHLAVRVNGKLESIRMLVAH